LVQRRAAAPKITRVGSIITLDPADFPEAARASGTPAGASAARVRADSGP
jgi:hypothetical protein